VRLSGERRHPALLFATLFAVLVATHASLLRLPYFWDEAGYFVPAARDLFLHGTLIPQSTLSNAHPPLVIAWLALAWKLAGFSPLVTRLAMLLVAAFCLWGVHRVAELSSNREAALGATLCTAIYPVFFAQSSLAHLDVAAAGLTMWGLAAYLTGRPRSTAAWFSLAALAKETAILAPLALLLWELLCRWIDGRRRPLEPLCLFPQPSWRRATALVFPVALLGTWFAYHFARTGYAFGNPEFIRYNVQATLHPVRILLAGLLRMWQLAGYMNMFMITLAASLAMMYPPLQENTGERPRIAFAVQSVFAAIIASYAAAMSVIGGAPLARYMLPAAPLVIILCVSTLWRRVRAWKLVIAIVMAGLAAGLFVNPPYGFAPEDNLAYRDYVLLHQEAERFVSRRFSKEHVLTAWPASDELTRPFLGYVAAPVQVVRIEDFSLTNVEAAADLRADYSAALLFSTKYEPGWTVLSRWRRWARLKERFFGYHQDVPPVVGAQLLGGQIVYEQHRGGQWVAVLEMERALEARREHGPAALVRARPAQNHSGKMSSTRPGTQE
jgi:hypothetical protein